MRFKIIYKGKEYLIPSTIELNNDPDLKAKVSICFDEDGWQVVGTYVNTEDGMSLVWLSEADGDEIEIVE